MLQSGIPWIRLVVCLEGLSIGNADAAELVLSLCSYMADVTPTTAEVPSVG